MESPIKRKPRILLRRFYDWSEGVVGDYDSFLGRKYIERFYASCWYADGGKPIKSLKNSCLCPVFFFLMWPEIGVKALYRQVKRVYPS